MQKRIVSVWFPRLPSNRVLRARPVDGPFVVTIHHKNADRIYCLNAMAEGQGLSHGMPFADARAFCPDVQSHVADPDADDRFLRMLMRWAKRYCPWVGLEGRDGLTLNISGSAHFFGGEAALLDDLRMRLARAGIDARFGLADTRGAAWALAHFGQGIAAAGQSKIRLASLPIAALRLDDKTCVALQRLGVRRIGDIETLPRSTLTRRFGTDVVMRMDQAFGAQPEHISPEPDAPHYGVRMTIPDPIGLFDDVMEGVKRLLERLCPMLHRHEQGARMLVLELRRVDQARQRVDLRLAQPMCDAARILPLFERGVRDVDAGFGIDQLRLVATQTDALPAAQITHTAHAPDTGLEDLITRLGTRIGLDNIKRFLPAESHIPERSFITAPAAATTPADVWFTDRPRPMVLFPPEPIAGTGHQPPSRFRWRQMALSTGRATGPERIAPEWWLPEGDWASGLRDYWKIETTQGRRLWLFYTPQKPAWFVQGEFA